MKAPPVLGAAAWTDLVRVTDTWDAAGGGRERYLAEMHRALTRRGGSIEALAEARRGGIDEALVVAGRGPARATSR